MSSTMGKNIILSLFGESHGPCVGATVHGLPAGIKLDLKYIDEFMDRRKARLDDFSTHRLEEDEYKIISGVTNGYTNGAPLTVIIENKKANKGDYDKIVDLARPSHADFTANVKFNGYNDAYGGGHFSGRLMAPVCFVGAVCKKFLEDKNIKIYSHLFSVGDIMDTPFDMTNIFTHDVENIYKKKLPVISEVATDKMLKLVKEVRNENDSIGGIIECACVGVPAGVGSPHFEGVENKISSAVFGIPAVKGIEFGSGFAGSILKGSENNDEFYINDGAVKTKTNNCGGILGGISNGMPIVFRVAVKPTASIGIEQNTINLKNKENTKIKISGRHDSCIALRAAPCVEAMTAIVICDMLMG